MNLRVWHEKQFCLQSNLLERLSESLCSITGLLKQLRLMICLTRVELAELMFCADNISSLLDKSESRARSDWRITAGAYLRWSSSQPLTIWLETSAYISLKGDTLPAVEQIEACISKSRTQRATFGRLAKLASISQIKAERILYRPPYHATALCFLITVSLEIRRLDRNFLEGCFTWYQASCNSECTAV